MSAACEWIGGVGGGVYKRLRLPRQSNDGWGDCRTLMCLLDKLKGASTGHRPVSPVRLRHGTDELKETAAEKAKPWRSLAAL